ncbi:MAG: OmpA family protein [Lysobacteraceae bacterium]|nr:MAG: OmpA family protein [Xanthomonadaceae bacterium]
MNKKLLCAALLSGLVVAQTATAQDYDDRWYITGSTGFNIQDGDRGTRNAPMAGIGFGKFLNQNWSLDAELNYQNPRFDDASVIRNNRTVGFRPQGLNWSQYGISFDLRRHFMAEGRNWNPYALVGLGYQRAEEEFDAFPNPTSPGQREDGNLAAKVGGGLQGDIGRVGIRTELAYRFDADDGSVNASSEDWFGDVLASVGVVIPLGPEAVEAPTPDAPPPPPAPNCADSDGDGDGVNDCNDRCPNSQAGEAIGPDGCKVQISIDLKGVNFDFDKAKLRPDAIAILNEAVEILKRYPELRVEVAGHTDLCGNDGYNQSLSQRRSQVVYDYLTSNGIDAGRLAGPNGYGESRPLVSTAQTVPECRSETNRRTELNVQ